MSFWKEKNRKKINKKRKINIEDNAKIRFKKNTLYQSIKQLNKWEKVLLYFEDNDQSGRRSIDTWKYQSTKIQLKRVTVGIVKLCDLNRYICDLPHMRIRIFMENWHASKNIHLCVFDAMKRNNSIIFKLFH